VKRPSDECPGVSLFGSVPLADASGAATVRLPGYFSALTRAADLRYQLTPIGASAPNLYAANTMGWTVGRPSLHDDVWGAEHWEQWAYDTCEKPKVGKRSREWAAVDGRRWSASARWRDLCGRLARGDPDKPHIAPGRPHAEHANAVSRMLERWRA
jgi:hypothetical protein